MSARPPARPNAENERQPLMKSLSPSTTASLCTAFVVLGLVIAWCIADLRQRTLNSELFDMTMMKPSSRGPEFQAFAYPLTLAMVEFAFTGLLFGFVYAFVFQDGNGAAQSSAKTPHFDGRWATLVASHVCGTFWLQSLMMPAQVMSLGLFAASRAADIPMTNILRSKMLGLPFEKRQLQTTCLTFAAACTLFYSYAQLSGCVCIWSGNGVALTGLAFWIMYFLILALPAVKSVCQEALLVQQQAHPLMVLAVQNLFACFLFTPLLSVAQFMGWEDVNEALSMIFQQKQILMTVIWLSLAMAATQALSILLISMTNSFWAVALRALRVVMWGGRMLMLNFLGSPLPLSITCPHSSLWALILTSGTFLAMIAIYNDIRSQKEDTTLDASKSSSFGALARGANKAIGFP